MCAISPLLAKFQPAPPTSVRSRQLAPLASALDGDVAYGTADRVGLTFPNLERDTETETAAQAAAVEEGLEGVAVVVTDSNSCHPQHRVNRRHDVEARDQNLGVGRFARKEHSHTHRDHADDEEAEVEQRNVAFMFEHGIHP